MAQTLVLKTTIRAGAVDTGVAMTKEPCTLDATRKKASVAAPAKTFMDPTAETKVYVGADAASATEVTTGFIFFHAGGHVLFENAVAAGSNVYVSGRYHTWAAVGECKTFNINIQNEVKDVTTIDPESEGWKKNKVLLREASVTLSGFLDSSLLNYLDPEAVGIIVYVEISYPNVFVWQGIGYMQSYSITGAHDDMVTNERTINTSGPIWFSAL